MLSFRSGDLLKIFESDDRLWAQAENFRTGGIGQIPRNRVTFEAHISNARDSFFNVDGVASEKKLIYPGVHSGTYMIRPKTSKIYIVQ